MTNRTWFIIILIVVNIALDQLSKAWVRANVEYNSVEQIIGDYFVLTHVENKGAFLGMGSDLNPTLKLILLIILPLLVLGFVLYQLLKDKTMDRWSVIGFCCILGGGIANLYDRIVAGKVTDFWHIDLGGVFKTGVFNIADMSVSFGLILLVIFGILRKPSKKETPA